MASSAGKAILLGEHAVVYGVPAIAAGLDRGATATARGSDEATLRVGDRTAKAGDGTELGSGFAALLGELGAPPCAVEVSLQIPPGVGLGGSAAIAVAAARAVFEWRGDANPELARVVDAAMAWERVFHGNPSGVDAWAAAHGGCVLYTRGSGIQPLRFTRDLSFAVAVAGPPASTRVMVEGLARLRERKKEMVEKSFAGIESLVKNAALCIEAGDQIGHGKLLDMNQMLLAGLFLSTEEIELACNWAREAGALGAKLTGGGGGWLRDRAHRRQPGADPRRVAGARPDVLRIDRPERSHPRRWNRENMNRAIAVAHANIALAKYWGKADQGRNLAAVPSLSLTLDGLTTRTDVEFDAALAEDEVVLDGRPARDKEKKRVVTLLDRVRTLAGNSTRARVQSKNSFPTAAGLASSASGFAALALAATRAAGLELSVNQVSALARAASVSAARSLHGGFVVLPAGAEHAEPLAPGSHFPLAMTVALTRAGEKAVGSTEGMIRTAATSPYYAGWLEHAPHLYERIRRAVLEKDLATLGPAVEASALAMHASMFAADPPIVYFSPVTLAVMERVRELRGSGLQAYFTMDAGPHVKVITLPEIAEEVTTHLAGIPGVLQVIRCAPGPDAFIENDGGARAVKAEAS